MFLYQIIDNVNPENIQFVSTYMMIPKRKKKVLRNYIYFREFGEHLPID